MTPGLSDSEESGAPSTATTAFSEALALVATERPGGFVDSARPPAFRYAPPGMVDGFWGAGGSPGVAGGPGGAVAAAHSRLVTGDLSATELVEQAIVAAEKQGMALGAVVELMAEQALAEAARLDRIAASGGAPLGPLHGIPITVKDIIHVAGVPTRAGSAAYSYVPDRDAVAVGRARAAGAIVVAKVSTHEFALGVTTPQSANPFDPSRIPGGSSGGSAIAVACGIGLASIGTDTRASIRVPAALCGVVGLKGTFGLVPTEGIVPLSWTMDHVAPIASTVADAALLLEVMAGRSVGDVGLFAGGSPGPGLRVGLAEACFEGCEASIAGVARDAIAALVASSGGALVALDRPDSSDLDLANAAGLVVSRCEAATFHRSLGADRSAYWDEVSDQLDAADSVTATDYLDAQRLRAVLAGGLRAVFDRCDVLCLPTVGVAPPMRDDYTRFLTVLSRSCVPWSLAGFPAVSVPCGFDSAGFPVGLQIVGPPGADGLVIAAASAVERERLAGA
ncbi:MAG: aspartyl-tRNA(Asn)/glutamyl-tRNA(Gln) amidotransferase subunit [Acidimicrobiaceae bacterium]|nr:aspartyl-tRNA(Asn)/glutamyl-tRNA(Gln) amidotransferase subunit [Acidimicrobiaceae bacterium]